MTNEEYMELWRARPASIPALLAAFDLAAWQLARKFEYLSGMDAAGLANDARVRALAAFDEFDPDRERAALFPFVYQRMRWHLMGVTKDESLTVHMPRKEWAGKRPSSALSLSDPKPGRKVRGLASSDSHPLDELIKQEEVRDLKRALRQLKPRLRQVLWKRAQGETLEAVGQKLGISRERARQLEVEGLHAIRRCLGLVPAIRRRRGGETP